MNDHPPLAAPPAGEAADASTAPAGRPDVDTSPPPPDDTSSAPNARPCLERFQKLFDDMQIGPVV